MHLMGYQFIGIEVTWLTSNLVYGLWARRDGFITASHPSSTQALR
jgi:hypothetical protein